MRKKVVVIGSGFAALTAAACIARNGHHVEILEKNSGPGGRARSFSFEGFTFDMGPSWYWMPDVFERYFQLFGKTTSDFYDLKRLSPSYRVYFGKGDFIDIPSDYKELQQLFESIEPGSAAQLDKFLKGAAYKYDVGINDLVYKPGKSIFEFFDARVIKGVFKLQLLQSFKKHVRKYFKNPRLLQILEFPILFLGALPENTPALYSLMNYADIKLGTWYPIGGMHKIVEALVKIAKEEGVKIHYDAPVEKILVENGNAVGVKAGDLTIEADVIVGGADYHHIEQNLLHSNHRNYSEKYWDSRKMAPSSLIYYVGLNKKLTNIQHHNLFFDEDFDLHAKEIYDEPSWPSAPLFYTCCPSLIDPSVAPEGHENLFFLIPVAPDLDDTEEVRNKYFDVIRERFERLTGNRIAENIVYLRSYAHKDFKNDYNAYKGNAYGLANTLKQTAILKPSMQSKRVKNLYYTGQLTVPGPGVPPSIISGQVVAELIGK